MTALFASIADTDRAQFCHEHRVPAAAFDVHLASAAPVPVAASTAAAVEPREHVVIIGGGFGGLTAALALRHAPVHVTLIDRRNYHLSSRCFTRSRPRVSRPPTSPRRSARSCGSQRNTTVVLGEVSPGSMSPARRCWSMSRRVTYDYLVARDRRAACLFRSRRMGAVRARPQDDRRCDRYPRRRILLAFERAENERRPRSGDGFSPSWSSAAGRPASRWPAPSPNSRARRSRPISATSIRDRRGSSWSKAAPRVLASFPEALSVFAKRALERLGVEVRLGDPCQPCDPEGVVVANDRIEADTIIWAAGVMASPAASGSARQGRCAGRVEVGPDLTLDDHPEIFVIGDTALALSADGTPLPGTAPVAKQEGA